MGNPDIKYKQVPNDISLLPKNSWWSNNLFCNEMHFALVKTFTLGLIIIIIIIYMTNSTIDFNSNYIYDMIVTVRNSEEKTRRLCVSKAGFFIKNVLLIAAVIKSNQGSVHCSFIYI